jgi:hypothetical protein
MIMNNIYDSSFYANRHDNTRYSAQIITQLIIKLINPKSVVDLGCGVGTWLGIMKEQGIDETLGIEGEWLNEDQLIINKNSFLKRDLSKEIKLEKEFDLAISMEVAEHINPANADTFVKNLISHAPVILFSAAIPFQGGSNHVNEQWPSYWLDKFKKHDYLIVDCIRKEIWDDVNIVPWYIQNTFVFVQKKKLNQYPLLQQLYTDDPKMLSVVHPRFYNYKIKTYPILKSIINTIKRKLNKTSKQSYLHLDS